MLLEKRLFFRLQERGTKWEVQYTTKKGSLITLVVEASRSGDISQDVMACVRQMVFAGERSSHTITIDRRISEIYHSALVAQQKRLQDHEDLIAQQG
jgi:hypothetical protein